MQELTIKIEKTGDVVENIEDVKKDFLEFAENYKQKADSILELFSDESKQEEAKQVEAELKDFCAKCNKAMPAAKKCLSNAIDLYEAKIEPVKAKNKELVSTIQNCRDEIWKILQEITETRTAARREQRESWLKEQPFYEKALKEFSQLDIKKIVTDKLCTATIPKKNWQDAMQNACEDICEFVRELSSISDEVTSFKFFELFEKSYDLRAAQCWLREESARQQAESARVKALQDSKKVEPVVNTAPKIQTKEVSKVGEKEEVYSFTLRFHMTLKQKKIFKEFLQLHNISFEQVRGR